MEPKIHYRVHKNLTPGYPEPDEFRSQPSILFLYSPFFIVLPSTPTSSSWLFLSCFPTEFYVNFSKFSCMLHAMLISSLIWSH